jgi:hypothetical protein
VNLGNKVNFLELPARLCAAQAKALDYLNVSDLVGPGLFCLFARSGILTKGKIETNERLNGYHFDFS